MKKINSKGTLQPMMFVVGSSLLEITKYIIFCNDVKQHFTNPVDAVIFCYALHFDFNFEYQSECEDVWQLIQLAFFGMEETEIDVSAAVTKYLNFFHKT